MVCGEETDGGESMSVGRDSLRLLLDEKTEALISGIASIWVHIIDD